jgi:hypothetical protein
MNPTTLTSTIARQHDAEIRQAVNRPNRRGPRLFR